MAGYGVIYMQGTTYIYDDNTKLTKEITICKTLHDLVAGCLKYNVDAHTDLLFFQYKSKFRKHRKISANKRFLSTQEYKRNI